MSDAKQHETGINQAPPGRWHRPIQDDTGRLLVELRSRLTPAQERAGLKWLLEAHNPTQLANLQAEQDELARTLANNTLVVHTNTEDIVRRYIRDLG